MYGNLESDERKRSEVTSSLFHSLMGFWRIPKTMRDYYGFTDDYELYHRLEGMDSVEYARKRQSGEIPDCLEVQARLTRSVEKVFEGVCRHPPVEYLDKMNGELEELDARLVRMTGRQPHADKLSSSLGRRSEEERPLRNFFRRPPSRGRKMSL